jgi:hypothetical protein
MKRIGVRQYSARGIGGIFRGLSKFFKPLIKFLTPHVKKAVTSKTGQKLLNQVKKSAVKAGVSVTSDILNGENVKETVGKNLKRASSDVLSNMNRVKEKKRKIKSKKLSKKQIFNFLG